MLDLTDKVAILTGASSGIGAALAPALSRRGVRLVLTARRADRLEATARLCPSETVVVPADVTVAADRERIVSRALELAGRIDLLVNNAGLGAYGTIAEIGEAEWRQLFEVNLFAPVLLTRAVLPSMLERRDGLVVNVASIGGLVAHSDRVTPYVASKHALVGFCRGLARDLAGTGVRVLAVCPHLTDTELFAVAPGSAEMASVLEQYKSFMDSSEAVASGIVESLGSDRLVVFPTPKPAKAYEKLRDI